MGSQYGHVAEFQTVSLIEKISSQAATAMSFSAHGTQLDDDRTAETERRTLSM
jgi:hypothetical protein